uniref:Aminotransferase class I/classII large domain-containing protein n=1 Tax=Opuntia streptacantha TaxID=393608 RepID=A0A7C9AXL5_OPUST
MANGEKEWGLKLNRVKRSEMKAGEGRVAIKTMVQMLRSNAAINHDDQRPLIPMAHGDPSPFPSFRTAAADSVVNALRSARFNGYCANSGLLPAREAVAEYISRDLPFKLSADDVHLTAGGKQAIHAVISSLAQPNANILLPRPGYSTYDAAAALSQLEVRHYDLAPEKGWEVDLDSVEASADVNTVAIVIINPGNPCGSVYSYQHLEKVAETARKLGLLVISDEVYDHITFGSKPFIRMGVFASRVPVVTLGSMSKRWMVPGWLLGWLVSTDPSGLLQKSVLLERVKAFFEVASDPATFIQAALPEIIQKTEEVFFSKIIDVLRQDADIIIEKIKEIPHITCPNKPEGSMFTMVKLNMDNWICWMAYKMILISV